jgi:hypothetical protein
MILQQAHANFLAGEISAGEFLTKIEDAEIQAASYDDDMTKNYSADIAILNSYKKEVADKLLCMVA